MKILTWEKSFEIDKIRGWLLKNLGQLSESFRQFRQNCILTVESRFYGEIFIVRTMLCGKIFRILGEKLSSFLRNCSCTSVRTAFYVNKRKAFLSIRMRNLFSKVFIIFQILSDWKQNLSSFSPLNFLTGLSKLHSGVQRNNSCSKAIWNNLFF